MTGSGVVALAELRGVALSIDEVVDAVNLPSSGCVVTFAGAIRDTDEGRHVVSLDYTAHPTAGAALRAVADEVAALEGVVAVAVVHRTGLLRVGDLAVVAAVAAGHRPAGFEGCRRLVDALKEAVPLWKRQSFADGTSEWVGMP